LTKAIDAKPLRMKIQLSLRNRTTHSTFEFQN